MKKNLIWIIMLAISIIAALGTSIGCVSVGIQNANLRSQNNELNQQVSDLNNQNNELEDKVQDLNDAVNNLQNTIGQYEGTVSLVTYEVNGKVWKLEVVQNDTTIYIPEAYDMNNAGAYDPEKQYFNGWLIKEGDNEIYTDWLDADTEVLCYDVTENTRFVADLIDKVLITYMVNEEVYDSEYVLPGKNFDLPTPVDNNDKYFNGWQIEGKGQKYWKSYSTGTNITFIAEMIDPVWEKVKNDGLTFVAFAASDVWHHNGNTYLSLDGEHYLFDSKTLAWLPTAWNNLPSSSFVDHVWTDGENTYYSNYSNQYILNGDTWEEKTWNGSNFFFGDCVWTDGENTYYSYSSGQYILNGDTWEVMNWNGLTSFYGNSVWTDGENTYYSRGTDQYVLKENNTWEAVTWTGLTSFDSRGIWTDGANTYYSSQYILKENNTWEAVTWTGLTSFNGKNIWTDGENIYYSYDENHYVLNKETNSWKVVCYKSGPMVNSFDSDYIWTDGENTYYSYYEKQFVLNKETNSWQVMTWAGLTSFVGEYIWTDGENTYYSNKNSYVLNKETNTWEAIWTDVYCDGRDIWTDGENIYIGDSHILNKETNTWEAMTWNGMSVFHGSYIWTDGKSTYWSNDSKHYVLNKETNTWEAKIWNGLNYFSANQIWTDGENTYRTYDGKHYILNKTTGTWEQNSLAGLPKNLNDGSDGSYIWKIGDDIYFKNYKLIKM